jgi:hypothetical protein
LKYCRKIGDIKLGGQDLSNQVWREKLAVFKFGGKS